MSQHDETRNDPTLNESTQGTDETTTIETLLDESDTTRPSASGSSDSPEPATPPASEPVSDRDSRPVDPSPAQPAAPSYASPYAPSYAAQATQQAVPEFKSGPAPTTSVLGLLGLLTAIAVLLSQATDLDIPWGVVGPVAVVGAGVLLVVLGLAGLRGQRFRG